MKYGSAYLPYLLCQIEELSLGADRHVEFVDFCAEMKADSDRRYVDPLLFWHLEPSSPDPGLSAPVHAVHFSPALPDRWIARDLDPQRGFSITTEEDRLTLTVADGARAILGELNAPRLLRECHGDFAIEARLTDLNVGGPTFGGLVIDRGEEGLILFGKATRMKSGVHLEQWRRGRLHVIGRGLLQGDFLHLRMERRGSRVRALCRDEHSSWMSCGELDVSDDPTLFAGLFARTPERYPSSRVVFSRVELIPSAP